MGGEAPREFGFKDHQGLCTGTPWDCGEKTLPLAHTSLHVPWGPRTKQGVHKNLVQTYLKVLEDLLGKQRMTVSRGGDKTLEREFLGMIM